MAGNSKLRITGARVYDPANGINGEIKDICICDGKIVADIEGGRTINATGMVVFPGGVDVHTHVAGAALNFARGMLPEDHRQNDPFVRTRNLRCEIQWSDSNFLRHWVSLCRLGLYNR